MQVCEPVDNLIDHTRTDVGVSKRFDSVGQILKRLRVAEIDAAYGEHQGKSKGPEADRLVQIPDFKLLSFLVPLRHYPLSSSKNRIRLLMSVLIE